MKNSITILLLLFSCCAGAQTLSPGNYTSSDGNYTVVIRHEGNTIWLTSPAKVEEYNGTGTMYYHVDPQYASYYLRVAGTNKYYTGKTGAQEYLFTFSGEASTQGNGQLLGLDHCPLYDKYLQLTMEEEDNVQAWAFCGAAAFAKCTYKEEAGEYLESIIRSLKSIIEDTTTCPCQDAITTAEWNSVTLD